QPLPVTAYGCSPAAKKPAPPKHTRKREIIRDSSGVGHQTKANTLGCHDGLQKGFFRCLDALRVRSTNRRLARPLRSLCDDDHQSVFLTRELGRAAPTHAPMGCRM